MIVSQCPLRIKPTPVRFPYLEGFIEDSRDFFMGLNHGQIGKYVYDGVAAQNNTTPKNNWGDLVCQHNDDYYIPSAEICLIQQAAKDIPFFVPQGTSNIEFGIGTTESLDRKTMPILTALGTRKYIAVDFCLSYLKGAIGFFSKKADIQFVSHLSDFFQDKSEALSSTQSIGTMLGCTIGNIYNPILSCPRHAVIEYLKSFSAMTKHGWLLISIDTNQDDASLINMYSSPLHNSCMMTPLERIARELPTSDFDPTLFVNDPLWFPETSLVAQTVRATESQSFLLDGQPLSVKKGQNLHIMNSYKFTQAFFESCCDQAGLDVVNVWHHETPIKLYLLKDRNPIKA